MANTSHNTPAEAKALQDLADRVVRIEITQNEVIAPTLKSVSEDVRTIASRDYITTAEASQMFAPKDDVKFLKNLVYALIVAAIGEFVALAFTVFKTIGGSR